MKNVIIGFAAGVVVTLIIAMLGQPYFAAWRSEMAFSMSADSDYQARCDASMRAADALRDAGNYDSAREWEVKGSTDCAVSRLGG